jgi:hypothetical protein
MAQELIKTYEKEIGELEDWIKTQANLPQDLGETVAFYRNLSSLISEFSRILSHFLIISTQLSNFPISIKLFPSPSDSQVNLLIASITTILRFSNSR